MKHIALDGKVFNTKVEKLTHNKLITGYTKVFTQKEKKK